MVGRSPRNMIAFADGFTDVTASTWDCAVNRSTGNSGSSMMLVNHFLDSVRLVAHTHSLSL